MLLTDGQTDKQTLAHPMLKFPLNSSNCYYLAELCISTYQLTNYVFQTDSSLNSIIAASALCYSLCDK